jgi:hypothetical protein
MKLPRVLKKKVNDTLKASNLYTKEGSFNAEAESLLTQLHSNVKNRKMELKNLGLAEQIGLYLEEGSWEHK